jgi:hypothetical protein
VPENACNSWQSTARRGRCSPDTVHWIYAFGHALERDTAAVVSCALANGASAHSAVTRTARRALPVELGMGRHNHRNATRRRTNDRRAARGNGTASSAVAPSERPVFAAHRSIIREWYCPQARIAARLTFQPLVRFRALLRLSVSPIRIA